MDNPLKRKLQYLGLSHLTESWEAVLKEASKSRPSYHSFLSRIVETEYEKKTEKARLARIKRARIPELLVMETFPFHKQPRLKKKLVLELYDSLLFMKDKQDSEGSPIRAYEFESSSGKCLTIEMWHDEEGGGRPEREAFLSHDIPVKEISVLQANGQTG